KSVSVFGICGYCMLFVVCVLEKRCLRLASDLRYATVICLNAGYLVMNILSVSHKVLEIQIVPPVLAVLATIEHPKEQWKFVLISVVV
ncbi:hypothetical protein KKF55_01130, partial [Patescibacteria group bacterium]|nr:hypothetical protein [Patescibacteria group bacterium]